jgi:hypothetical protein
VYERTFLDAPLLSLYLVIGGLSRNTTQTSALQAYMVWVLRHVLLDRLIPWIQEFDSILVQP